ncbi:hypothetical protein C1701_16535 [Actinoalloteichus sp. AHMU CJ021]|uniref:hypothetical protein n=1 Tax=Actinoalloteichus TaxID=65496 RepID=UPI0004BF9AF8|nr:hypothetical protein [Actinoalloteichus caeruleus]AUS79690.1 hypothetical protein C1701_16535 [Actinoalloteichus sp. AHMU CJ021]
MSGSYEVDPEALPRAIAELEEARESVLDLQAVATNIGSQPPTRGDDQISLNAGEQFALLAESPQSGSLGLTAQELVTRLEETIEAFKEMLREYLELDAAATLPEYDGDVTRFESSPTYQERLAAANSRRSADGYQAI